MSWNTVERHGQPPIGSLCRQSNQIGYAWVHTTDHGRYGADTLWLAPGTVVTLGDLPSDDDVAPAPMSDADKRALRMVNVRQRLNGRPGMTSLEDKPSNRRMGEAYANEALRMCADLLDSADPVVSGCMYSVRYLRNLADGES